MEIGMTGSSIISSEDEDSIIGSMFDDEENHRKMIAAKMRLGKGRLFESNIILKYCSI